MSWRLMRHGLFAALGSAIVALVCFVYADRPLEFQLSIGTAYVAAAFLTITLMLGPLYVILLRKRVASTSLRRDLAIWSGLYAIAHTGFGLLVHFGGSVWPYFLSQLHPIPTPRADLFGLANYLGLIAVVIIAGLVAISNNPAMRGLGLDRWKNLQRVSPWVGALVFFHAVAYQVLEGRELPFIVLSAAFALAVVAIRLGRHHLARRVVIENTAGCLHAKPADRANG